MNLEKALAFDLWIHYGLARPTPEKLMNTPRIHPLVPEASPAAIALFHKPMTTGFARQTGNAQTLAEGQMS